MSNDEKLVLYLIIFSFCLGVIAGYYLRILVDTYIIK